MGNAGFKIVGTEATIDAGFKTDVLLFNKRLKSITFKNLDRAAKIRVLTLCDNWLTSLPVEIGRLTGLRELSLRNNQLTSVPAEIGNLTSLTVLNLNKNRLTSVPAEIGNLTSLTQLYLSDNRLTSVPAEIGNLAGLRSLGLNFNPLTTPPLRVCEQGIAAIRTYFLEHPAASSPPAAAVRIQAIYRGTKSRLLVEQMRNPRIHEEVADSDSGAHAQDEAALPSYDEAVSGRE